MKPNDFILNSDYLTLALLGKTDIDFTVPARSLNEGEVERANYYFNAPRQIGGIDRFYVSIDGNNYSFSYTKRISYGAPYVEFNFSRAGESQIKVEVVYSTNTASSSYDFPAYHVLSKVYSFKPPNIN